MQPVHALTETLQMQILHSLTTAPRTFKRHMQCNAVSHQRNAAQSSPLLPQKDLLQLFPLFRPNQIFQHLVRAIHHVLGDEAVEEPALPKRQPRKYDLVFVHASGWGAQLILKIADCGGKISGEKVNDASGLVDELGT